jgi:uncharacterized protein (TIGR00290 family)
MHGITNQLLKKQIKALDMKIRNVFVDYNQPNNYDIKMQNTLLRLKKSGYNHCCFGDIFLEDLKQYRIKQLHKINMHALFPLWNKKTNYIARKIIESGFKAIVVCVDLQKMDKSYCGREYNYEFIKSLPQGIDPCGENGEFHTFCYAGPVFKEKINFKKGKIVIKKYASSGKIFKFAFQELI